MTMVSRLLRRRWRWLGLVALLGVYFAQAVAASPHNSVTFDEQYHLTLGYTYLKTGDLRLHRDQSPPLFEIFASLPLLLRSDLNLPLDHPAYALWGDVYLFSDVFLWHANADAQGIARAGRVVAAGFGVLLGILLFAWARQLFGEMAGWLAVFLLAFDPNLIANAIPTLDLGLAFFVTLAAWRLWHYLRRPTRRNVLLAGLALGAALATKFISVALLPAFALVLVIHPAPRAHEGSGSAQTSRREYGGRALAFAAMLGLALLVIWAAYGFQLAPIGGAGVPVPAPMYFESFLGMLAKSGEGRLNFLNGDVSLTGWPHYFGVALLVKTPLPTLILLAAALIRWPWRREWRESAVLLLPPLLLFIGASIGRLQLGYRYILPVLPFLILVASRVVAFRWSRWARVPFAALLVWLVVGTLSIYPHHLSYFNEAAGGPANGYNWLVDSNLDWGQDLPALRDWIDRAHPDDLRLGFFGTAYPDRYGVQAEAIPGYPLNAYGPQVDGFTSYSLEPGQYALSATLLRLGLVFRQFDLYRAFRSMTPVDRAGYSILIYEVAYPPGAEIDRAVISGPLASDVSPDALGWRPDHPLRAKWCAWPECFVFTPHPARYIVRDFIPFAPDLAARAQAQATPVETATPAGSAAYELDAAAILEDKLAALQAAPAAAPDGSALSLPIRFDNGLSLAGYEVRAERAVPGGELDVVTYWRVDDRIAPPLAIFVHLLDAQGNIRGQHDGFGAAVAALEPGDIVVQHHSLPIAEDAGPGDYQLQVGLYNPVTLDRFSAHPPDMQPIDRVLLSKVGVHAP